MRRKGGGCEQSDINFFSCQKCIKLVGSCFTLLLMLSLQETKMFQCLSVKWNHPYPVLRSFIIFFYINCKTFYFFLISFIFWPSVPKFQDLFESFFLSSKTLNIISSFMNLIAWNHQLRVSQQYSVAGFIKLTVIVKYINRSMTSKGQESIPLLNLELVTP